VSESEHEEEKMEEDSPLHMHGRIRTALSTWEAASIGEAGSAVHNTERAVTGGHRPRVTHRWD
jgi:hypothetical protein